MGNIRDYQGRIFAGILLICIGVIFLLSNTGRMDFGDFLSTYWPLILIFIGLWHLFSRSFQNAGLGILLIAIGAFFLLVKFGLLGGRTWAYFWPLLIIAAGLWLLFRPARFRGFKGKIPEIKDDDMGAFAVFSGIKRRFESERFRGGKATAIFGGMEIDLTQVKLADNQATVALTAIFGGIDLFVPREWKVVVDSNAILGGVDDKHSPASGAPVRPILYVRATAILGGIDIKN
jgi:predicted membrane protein